jgi:sugar phosphate isomerase/epimerase
MHIATHNWMRPESIKRTIERMRETGVDALEISGEPDQYDPKEVRKLLADNGRKCWGSVTLTLGERNLASKDTAQRDKTVAYMKRVVTLAKELDGQIITLVPATVRLTKNGSGWSKASRRSMRTPRKPASASPSSR